MTYRALTTQTPPAVGASQRLWCPELFDETTGRYTAAGNPAYPVDADGKFTYYLGSELIAQSSWTATTGDDLLHAYQPSHVVPSTALASEQARWAIGRISWHAAESHYQYTCTVNTGTSFETFGVLPAKVSNSVRIAGVVYPVASIEWSDPTDHEITHDHATDGDTDEDRTNSNIVVVLTGAPDLSTILAIGTVIEWV